MDNLRWRYSCGRAHTTWCVAQADEASWGIDEAEMGLIIMDVGRHGHKGA